MKVFPDNDFLLNSEMAKRLYFDYAAAMPIIDYHCHLPPQQVAENHCFKNLTEIWLQGDHYKWRAMRANGINEKFITGEAADAEKFQQWAATVPYTLRNPLYHWTHLELQRYFDISNILNEDTAKEIYDTCTEKLQTAAYSVKNLLRKMNVKLICTTDDPADSLEYHKRLKEDTFEIAILPAFRPDAAMNVEDAAVFNLYLSKLEQASNTAIDSFPNYINALQKRHDFFAENGCTVSDHGLEEIYAEDCTDQEAAIIFSKLRSNKNIGPEEKRKFKSTMLKTFAIWDCEKGWVQQYHVGALRNNNSRMLKQAGADTGFDSIGDFSHARSLSKFLDSLDKENKLAKTILYNLNPADNEIMATMACNFNDGSIPGKIQWGAAWWFLDQEDGIVKQLNGLSNMGLLSRFIGMLTDSRSFLSYPRHEYFRRILCNLLGEEIEKGKLPHDVQWTGKIIQDICFYNARQYFNWEHIHSV